MIQATNQSPDTRLALSVVIVTYNEENRIRNCIESVVAASRGLVEFELILVDSNSTDRTVEIAAEYPITIFQIPDDELTTPGAGRYVGTQVANGEMILFVDGDMIVKRNWLERAITVLKTEEGTAAVDGQLNAPAETNIESVDAVRGVALYNADALAAVGGFDPHLKSLEDIHLGFELTAAGYDLRRLPEVAASHPPRPTVAEPFRRWRRGYMLGTGQAVRKSLWSRELVSKHLYRMRHRFTLFGWLCVGIGSLLSLVTFVLWFGLSLLAGAVLVSKLGLTGGAMFLISKLMGLVGLARGLFITPKPADAFPLDRVETIQRGSIHHEQTQEVVE